MVAPVRLGLDFGLLWLCSCLLPLCFAGCSIGLLPCCFGVLVTVCFRDVFGFCGFLIVFGCSGYILVCCWVLHGVVL